MESELAFSIADRYIYIQDATEGYDYTIYDSDFTELDGGIYDDPENSIYEALDEIVEDLKMQPDTDRIKGEITEESQLIPVNLEEFEEALERSHYVPPEVTYTVAERICHPEEYGEQDVALAIQEAREKIEEKRLTPNTTPYIL